MIPNNILQVLGGITPQQIQSMKTPDDVAQYLLNSGKVTQEQVNQARQMWEQPNIRQMIQKRFGY